MPSANTIQRELAASGNSTMTRTHPDANAAAARDASPTRSIGDSAISSESPSSPNFEASGLLSPLPTGLHLTRGRENPWGSSPMPSPSLSASTDISVQARYGSGPPSPLLRGMQVPDGGESDMALPWPKGGGGGAGGMRGLDIEERIARPRINTDLQPVQEQEGESPKAQDQSPEVHQAPQEVPKKGLKNYRVIAIDFDDVCAQFIPTITKEHNLLFGTDLTAEDVQTYNLFQNKGWGTMAETARKMALMDRLLPKTLPVPGFAAALKAIRALGHPIHIVTARSKVFHADVVEWLKTQGITVGMEEEDTIAHIWCTDSYGSTKPTFPPKGDTARAEAREKEFNERLKEIWAEGIGSGKGGKSKLKPGSSRDGNLEPIVSADPPIPCLLFGKYTWNQNRSGVSSPVELMNFEERLASGLALPSIEIEEGAGLQRAENWEAVVQLIKEWDAADGVPAL